MFGNTHVIADHIATGLRTQLETTVVGVHDATVELVESADLVVVGGPTHVHGMTSQRSRDGAKDMAAKDSELAPRPRRRGTRAARLVRRTPRRAARAERRHSTHGCTPARCVTGQASKGIAKRLRRHGFDLLVEPESFFVDKSNHLEPDEADRAEAWGRTLAETLVQARDLTPRPQHPRGPIGPEPLDAEERGEGDEEERVREPDQHERQNTRVQQPGGDHPHGSDLPAEQRDRRRRVR